MPLVSIIITTYNYDFLLERVIASALAQTYARIEVLVCDNASTDSTQELMQAYAPDSRVRYFRHAENIGSTANHNFGGAAAQGAYLVFLSADDILYPQHIARGLAFLLEHPEIDIAHSAIALMDRDGNNVRELVRNGELAGTYAGQRNEVASLLAYSGYMCMTTMLISRELWETHGDFTHAITAIDYEYTLRLASRGVRIGYFPTVTAAISIHADSISGSNGYLRSGDDVRDFLYLIDTYALSDPECIHGYEHTIIRHLESKFTRCTIHGMGEAIGLQAQLADRRHSLLNLAAQPIPVSRQAQFGFVVLADAAIRYVMATIHSVLAQTDEHWVMTVVLSAGVDHGDLFTSLDPRGRITTLRLHEPMTNARAANFGMLRLSADAMRILRAGTVLDTTALAQTRVQFNAETMPVVIAAQISRAARTGVDDIFVAHDGAREIIQAALAEHGDYLFATTPLLPLEAFTVARSLLDRMYFFDEQLHALFMWEFFLRAGANARTGFADSTVVLDAALCAQPAYAAAIAADTQRIHRLYPVAQPELVSRRAEFRRAIETVRGEVQAAANTVLSAEQLPTVLENQRRLFRI